MLWIVRTVIHQLVACEVNFARYRKRKYKSVISWVREVSASCTASQLTKRSSQPVGKLNLQAEQQRQHYRWRVCRLHSFRLWLRKESLFILVSIPHHSFSLEIVCSSPDCPSRYILHCFEEAPIVWIFGLQNIFTIIFNIQMKIMKSVLSDKVRRLWFFQELKIHFLQDKYRV
jgi:hypothetical protein